jgi:hypothetical protein
MVLQAGNNGLVRGRYSFARRFCQAEIVSIPGHLPGLYLWLELLEAPNDRRVCSVFSLELRQAHVGTPAALLDLPLHFLHPRFFGRRRNFAAKVIAGFALRNELRDVRWQGLRRHNWQ